jgi:hypothetical protein
MKKLSYTELNKLLSNIQKLEFYDKLKKILFFRLDTPYKNNPFQKEKVGIFPFFPVRISDCVSFVLTSISLALSKSIMQAKLNIVPLHYKKNKISYSSRYHFTEDRIINNKYFSNLSNKFSDVKKINIYLNKKNDGSKLLDMPFQRKISINYLTPQFFLDNIKSLETSVINIAFCRFKNIGNGHFISHEGFLIDNKYLIHSSQTEKKVVKIDIKKYLTKYKFDGVIPVSFIIK